MIRAPLRLIRCITSAAILLGLLVCGAEVGVRITEVVQGQPICSGLETACRTDPTRLSIPSWLIDRELQPHAASEVRCRDRKRTIEIRTNSHGLRSFEAAVPKPKNTYRIVILGDETILAPEIPDDEHFVTLVSDALQSQTRVKVEVINASFPGACPLTEYLFLKHRLLSLQPDLVLVHFDWSDVCEDRQLRRQSRTDASGVPLSCPHASLVAKPRKPNCLETLRQQFRLIDWGLNLAGQQWKERIAEEAARSRDTATNLYAWMRQERPESDIHVVQSFKPLTELARLSCESYFKLIVLTSPKPWQVSARCTSDSNTRMQSGVAAEAYYPSRAPFAALASLTQSLSVPNVDLSPALVNCDNPEGNYLRYSPRWSPQGHRRVAEFLARFLIEQVPGPWNSRYFREEGQNFGQQPEPREIQWASGTR